MSVTTRVVACAAVLAGLVSPAAAGKMNDKHKKWLEDEVRVLVTKDEEKEFKELKDDSDRDRFVELFWAKRDPTPLTPANELKNEFYKRLAFVTSAQFPRARGGIRSDLARVFLLLGQPSQQAQEASALNWTYTGLQQLGSDHPAHFRFAEGANGLELVADESDGVAILAKVPGTMLLHPELKELPTYPHMLEKAMTVMLDELAQSGQPREEMPCDISFKYLESQAGATYVSIIAVASGEWPKGAKLAAFGRCAQGTGVQEFNEPMEVSGAGADTTAFAGFALMPGTYELTLGVMDKDSKKVTLRKIPLEVPKFDPAKLEMSIPVTSDAIETMPAETSGEKVNPFAFGRYKLAPKSATPFSKASSLFVFYNVYNCGMEAGETNLTAEYVFNKDGKYFNRIPPEVMKQKAAGSAAIVLGTEVPLATFPPGKYTVTVKLEDKTSGATASKEAAFEIK